MIIAKKQTVSMSEAASLSRDQNKANDFALTFIDSMSDKTAISMPSLLKHSVAEPTNHRFLRNNLMLSNRQSQILCNKRQDVEMP